MHVNRREFLRKSLTAALGGVGVCSALGNLRLMAATLGAQTTGSLPGYKALVCVFLYGGNDSLNTIVPTSGLDLSDYLATRGSFAQTAGLHALTPLAGGGPSNYALHAAMPELASLFNAGQAGIVANVGSLLRPVTAQEYQSASVAVPPQLFSHLDQATQWQTSRPDDANALGWGGRMADLLHSANSGLLPMNISVSSTNQFQRGAVVSQYGLSPSGVSRMHYQDNGNECWISDSCSDYGAATQAANAAAYNALIAPGVQANALERAYAAANSRSIANYQLLGEALTGAPALSTPFPAENSLAEQLKMVAQVIGVRSTLGMSRQIFFVSAKNYDTHTDQIDNQQYNLQQLSQAMAAFHAATVELGVANDVTSFTASDFGRSLAFNSSGTDHGWGGHHFVMGGSVRGANFYGSMPSLQADNNPDDTGWGQIIPTLAVDQYAATLARWMGVDSGGIADIFPNLGEFTSADLGFML